MSNSTKTDIVVTLGVPESGRTTYLDLIAKNFERHFGKSKSLGFTFCIFGEEYARVFPNECVEHYQQLHHSYFNYPSNQSKRAYQCNGRSRKESCCWTYSSTMCECCYLDGISFNMIFKYETEPNVPDLLKPIFPNDTHDHTVVFADIASKFCLYSKLINDSVATGRLRELVAKADHILLFVDSEKFCQNAPEVRDSIIGCMHVLQQRILERKDPLHIGVVMSKGDLLQTDPHYFHDGSYDMGRLRWRFMELFQNLIPSHEGNSIRYDDVQIEYDFFCVSSIHAPEHRFYNKELGKWMRREGMWNLCDMNNQAWPLLWCFERLGLPLRFFNF